MNVFVLIAGDFHSNHSTQSVIKRVEDIKEEWKKRVEDISNHMINNQVKEVDIQSEKLTREIDQTTEEIKRLEDTLKSLIDKKERMIADLNMMKESKEKISHTTSFLLFFLQTLPSLPLSSFLPSSTFNFNNNNEINIEEEDKEEKGRRRIIEFLRKSLFTLLFFTSFIITNNS